MLAGGIPTRTRKHADNVADMALKMLKVIKSIPNPDSSEPGKHIEIRTGRFLVILLRLPNMFPFFIIVDGNLLITETTEVHYIKTSRE